MNSVTNDAAAVLADCRLANRAFTDFEPGVGPVSETDAYNTQMSLHELLVPKLGPIVGHKIGCTTKVMQEFLKIDNPCAGGIFESGLTRGHATLSLKNFVHIGVECEIAVRLSKDLPPSAAPFTRTSVADSVASCMVGIELVDDRYQDYSQLSTPTLIADDFFGAGCVLGKELHDFDPFSLEQTSATMEIGGEIVGHGRGTDVLGNPLDALVWLANHMADMNSVLRSGEIIMLGSLVRTQWIEEPTEIIASNVPLGEVTLTFTS